MKGYLKQITMWNIFCRRLLEPFLNETAFYDKRLGGFSGSQTKSTSLIATKFGTNMQLINLKLLSKFHEAKPNRSWVISKSQQLRTRQFENGREKQRNTQRQRQFFQWR